MDKHYAERDIVKQGQVYVDHVSAMTGEGLHEKSDIAAELAHRDIEIQKLQQRNKALGAAFTAAKGYIDASPCDPDINNEQIEAYQKYQEALAQLDKEGNQ